jgi:hypothetical protein
MAQSKKTEVTYPIALEVVELHGSEMYKDTVHVHYAERNHMPNGEIVRVSVTHADGARQQSLFAMRGRNREDPGKIGIDFIGGAKLKVEFNQKYQFTFEKASLLERLRWARESADPTARIAMWIAYWSAIIGVAGFVLGVIGAVPIVREWFIEKSSPIQYPSPAPLSAE